MIWNRPIRGGKRTATAAASVRGCGHHWHCSEAGWSCCACHDWSSRLGPPPPTGTLTCQDATPPPPESVREWLATAAPVKHRPGRRAWRRPGGTA